MTQDATQTYAAEGFLTQIDLFNESEINHFRTCFDELESKEGREKCQIGLPIPTIVGDDLREILVGTIRSSLQRPFAKRKEHEMLFRQYCSFHVEHLHSFDSNRPTFSETSQ